METYVFQICKKKKEKSKVLFTTLLPNCSSLFCLGFGESVEAF